MKFLKVLIIFVTMLVGGSLLAKSPQGIGLPARHVPAQVVTPCLSEPGNFSNISTSCCLCDANSLPDQIFKKFYSDDEALCQLRQHNPNHHIASPMSGVLDLGKVNILDTEKIYHSPLAFPGAVLYFRMEDMSKIMARE